MSLTFRLLDAPALRGLHSSACAFGDDAPFQLSQNAYHLPHGAARGCCRVDCLGERMEFHATGAKVVEHRYQVAQAAAQPVGLPHNERIAVFQSLRATEKGRALRRGSRKSLILVDAGTF